MAGVGDGSERAEVFVGGLAGAGRADGGDVVGREAEGEADDDVSGAVGVGGASGRFASVVALVSSDATDRSNSHVPPAPARRTRTAAMAVKDPVSAYRAGFRPVGALVGDGGGDGGGDPW
ncbi:hypothetical protein SNL152K_4880 [Streptomyces sp. NL15-2K]|nr:hypothetical protein SNL152K_4880 [Streptomyces sp. NL15-2K]